jgi:hypothetical protein
MERRRDYLIHSRCAILVMGFPVVHLYVFLIHYANWREDSSTTFAVSVRSNGLFILYSEILIARV